MRPDRLTGSALGRRGFLPSKCGRSSEVERLGFPSGMSWVLIPSPAPAFPEIYSEEFFTGFAGGVFASFSSSLRTMSRMISSRRT